MITAKLLKYFHRPIYLLREINSFTCETKLLLYDRCFIYFARIIIPIFKNN